MSAAQIVREHLLSVLPRGVPPCFSSIRSGVATGRGRKTIYRAELVMFDGRSATVEVFGSGPGLKGHRWTAMDGGAAFFENGKWQREPPVAA